MPLNKETIVITELFLVSDCDTTEKVFNHMILPIFKIIFIFILILILTLCASV